MVTPVASRFALLALDDDGDTRKKLTKNLAKKKNETNNNRPNLNDTKNKRKKFDTVSKDQSQNGMKPPKSKSAKKDKKNNVSDQQWEQWKEKDNQAVNGSYEVDLQEALLLSQLDYEKKKDQYELTKKEQENEKKNTKKGKKGNKAQPMSLGQFNSLTDAQIDLGDMGGGDSQQANSEPQPDPEFFDRIKSDAKKAIDKEQAEAKRKAREPLIDEVITQAQYKDRLEHREQEIARLEEEVKRLKEELQKVKTRNQKLCELLFKGEMEDKAKLLVALDKMQKVKDELSNEVSNLHIQLEQERSKPRSANGDNKHNNKKKNVKFDASNDPSINKDKEKR